MKSFYRSLESEPLLRTSAIFSHSGSGSHSHDVHKPTVEVTEEGHCHGNQSEDRVDRVARRKLIIASLLCLVFMIAESVGGALAGSLAIMTDAAHLFTDFASFMISLLALFLASLPPTKRMSFGWYRAEIVGAMISVLMIWVVTGILVYLAINRVMNPDYQIHSTIMLLTAFVGVVVNLIMAATLHQHGHSHGGGSEDDSHAMEELGEAGEHGHSHSDSSAGSHSHQENVNVRAAFIHVIGDFLQSLGVFAAALIIYFKPSYKIADPICTFIFSILVLATTFNILRDTMHVLMEGVPKSLDFNRVKLALSKIPGVVEVHSLRMWSLTTRKSALSVHLAYDSTHDPNRILRQANKILHNNYKISDITIQMEPYQLEMANCDACKDPKD